MRLLTKSLKYVQFYRFTNKKCLIFIKFDTFKNDKQLDFIKTDVITDGNVKYD